MTEKESPAARPQRKALGRGLDALLGARQPAAAPPAAGERRASPPFTQAEYAGYRDLPLDVISPNPDQPRKNFDPQALAELAESIRQNGLIQPIIVTEAPGSPGRFLIVAGERRWRAARLAELQLIPTIVKPVAPDLSLELALVENLQREDLNPVEAAVAFDRLVREFSLTHDEIARRTGKDRATITNFVRLLRLPTEVLQLVADGKVSLGHAKALLTVSSRDLQIRLANEIAGKDLSVRATEQLAARLAAAESAETPRSGQGRRQPRWDANVRAAVQDLERCLGTRVRLSGTAKKGRLVIEYYSEADLMRIYDAIVTDLRQ